MDVLTVLRTFDYRPGLTFLLAFALIMGAAWLFTHHVSRATRRH
jgi:hypothetical protein